MARLKLFWEIRYLGPGSLSIIQYISKPEKFRPVPALSTLEWPRRPQLFVTCDIIGRLKLSR